MNKPIPISLRPLRETKRLSILDTCLDLYYQTGEFWGLPSQGMLNDLDAYNGDMPGALHRSAIDARDGLGADAYNQMPYMSEEVFDALQHEMLGHPEMQFKLR